jgi:hypothetical protein
MEVNREVVKIGSGGASHDVAQQTEGLLLLNQNVFSAFGGEVCRRQFPRAMS